MKIKIPNKWSDIKLGQFIEMSKWDGLNEKEQVKKFIELFNPEVNIDDILLSELEEITHYFNFLTTPPTTLHNDFIINGDLYRWNRGIDKITIGEMISYEILVEKAKGYEYGSILLSILLKKVVDGKEEDFNADILNDRRKLFEDNLTMDEVYGLIFFLLIGESPSILTIQGCLEQAEQWKKELEMMNKE